MNKIKESDIRYIAGLDISFSKIDKRKAIAVLVIHDYSMYKKCCHKIVPVYCDTMEITLRIPYDRENFTYREGPFYIILLQKLKEKQPQYFPDVVLVDGPGKMHEDHILSLATYVGMSLEIPTIGITKKFYPIGTHTREQLPIIYRLCKKSKDYLYIYNNNNKKIGITMKTTNLKYDKIFIYASPGYKISLKESIKIIQKTCIYKLQQPIKDADQIGRQKIAQIDQRASQLGGHYILEDTLEKLLMH